MTDIKSKEDRSRNMAAIRSRDTGPEVYFRKMLFSKGIRYRKNVSYVSGHPDLFMRKYGTAIFINGCFWHRHKGCRYAYVPKSRTEFWELKFQKNISRDEAVRSELADAGIRQLIIWECTIKKMKKDREFRKNILDATIKFLSSDISYMEL